MKSKLIKFAAAAFFAMLPLPFIFDWSFIFGNVYLLVAIMICGVVWGQLSKAPSSN